MAELPPGFTLIEEPAESGPLGVTVAPNRRQQDVPALPEGFTLIPAEKPGMLETAARSAVQGLTFGLADESYGLTQGVRGLLSGEGFGAGYDRGVKEFRDKDKAGREANPITGVLGEIAGGMATGYGAASAGATLMRGGMSLPQAIAAGAAEGAGYGALHGAGNAEGGLEDRAIGAGGGAITGAITGAAVPLIARGIGAGVNALRGPTSIPAERQGMVEALRREGVPVTAGQATGSKPLLYAESILGDAPLSGGRAADIMTRQGEAFTDAAMRRAGASGRASPENMAALNERLGNTFRDLSARNTLVEDFQLGMDLRSALREYDRVLPTEQRRIVGNLVGDISERLTQARGRMPGAEYQTARSRLSRMAQNTRQSDPEFSQAIRGVRNALDDAMERSISPRDAAAWQTARDEYGAMRAIERAVGGAGSDSALGLISPRALRQAVTRGDGGAYTRGEGPFADLVRAGNALMTPLPNSGTAQRVTVGTGVTGLAGALAGSGNLGAAAVSALGPGLAGRALLSQALQSYLSRPELGPVTRRAIEARLRALTQGGAQTQSQKLYSPRR